MCVGLLRDGETYILDRTVNGGMKKEYIKLRKGGKRIVRRGPKGGKKMYIK